MVRMKYPTTDEVILHNKLAIKNIKVKKADKPEVLSYTKIDKTIKTCKKKTGDVYDKATCLLTNITREHPFGSANRRTAFSVTENFLIENKIKPKVDNGKKFGEIAKGIRADFYSDNEIKKWLKGKRIRKFKR